MHDMNFAAFDLNLLKAFDALMKERSATRAGDLIGLSQPAVSNALNRLRHALGDELFVRRGNDMIPTPRAEALAERIRDALVQVEQAIAGDAAFDPTRAERIFTLMGADFFSIQVMPALSEQFARAAPGIRLRLIDSGSGDVERFLRDNVIDAALERPLEMPDWVSRELLFHSPFVVIAARGHKVIRKAGVKPGDRLPLAVFCALPHALRSIDGSMSGAIDAALQRAGATRQVTLALPHFQGIALAVARGHLIAAVPLQFAQAVAKTAGLEIYQPPLDVPVPQIRLYWHKRHDRNPAHRWLREQIADAMKPFRTKEKPPC
jgi:DNA-binding transcriptional LysR family regulator